MNIKKLVISTIIAGVLFFLLGWLVYGNLLDHYMRHHSGKLGNAVNRPEPVMIYVAAGSFLQGALLAYIFTKANVKSLAEGLITGAIIGLLIAAFSDFYMYGMTYMTSKRAILADLAASATIYAVAGAVLGIVSGNSEKNK